MKFEIAEAARRGGGAGAVSKRQAGSEMREGRRANMKRAATAKTVGEYIRARPKDVRAILEKFRETIRKAAPEAEESISYRMPAIKFRGAIIAYFAAFQHHVGFFPPAPNAFRKETSAYAGPKGNLRFPMDEPIPWNLVKRIIESRVKEIAGKKPKK
ncbi:MAG: iron chaperone [Candidatus Acidiferrales bacterium]